jgi:hypothetical protein
LLHAATKRARHKCIVCVIMLRRMSRFRRRESYRKGPLFGLVVSLQFWLRRSWRRIAGGNNWGSEVRRGI